MGRRHSSGLQRCLCRLRRASARNVSFVGDDYHASFLHHFSMHGSVFRIFFVGGAIGLHFVHYRIRGERQLYFLRGLDGYCRAFLYREGRERIRVSRTGRRSGFLGQLTRLH